MLKLSLYLLIAKSFLQSAFDLDEQAHAQELMKIDLHYQHLRKVHHLHQLHPQVQQKH